MKINNEKFKAAEEYLRVIVHPSRALILKLIMEKGPISAGNIGKELSKVQTLISRELKPLRESGIISFRRQGKNIFYYLNKEEYDKRVEFAEKINRAG